MASDSKHGDASELQVPDNLHQLLQVSMHHINDAVLITQAEPIDEPGPRIVWANPAFYKMTGYEPHEIIGENPRLLQGPLTDRHVLDDIRTALEKWEPIRAEALNYKKDGSTYWVEFEIVPIANGCGWFTHWVSVQRDVTDRRHLEDQLRQMAQYDSLTQLPNRQLLDDRLKLAISQVSRNRKHLAVVFLDLDGFKDVNDTYGHVVGDEVLGQLAGRIKLALRGGDTLARVGGDEFVALIPDLDVPNDVLPIIERVLAASASTISVNDHDLNMSASLGISLYPQSMPVHADQLVQQADQAMYKAKALGKNRFHFYSEDREHCLGNVLKYQPELGRALQEDQLELYFQPKINMRSGQVFGAEALIRWNHPDRGLLLPGQFLHAITKNKLAVDIGEWVVCAALKQQQAWKEQGLALAVSVNIDAFHLQQDDFVANLQQKLNQCGQYSPGDLEIEILESSALENILLVSSIIKQCRALGVNFALDDFGTGYSSLNYLKRLPTDVLKIDQGFVRDMLEDPDDLAILDGVIGLSRAFRLNCVAEGVETEKHGLVLLKLGVELAQGYAIAKPMPANELPEFVAGWQSPQSWRHCEPISRDLVGVLFARAEHALWVKQVQSYCAGDLKVVPELDGNHCKFSDWLNDPRTLAAVKIDHLQQIMQTHDEVHHSAQMAINAFNNGFESLVQENLRVLQTRHELLLHQLDDNLS